MKIIVLSRVTQGCGLPIVSLPEFFFFLHNQWLCLFVVRPKTLWLRLFLFSMTTRAKAEELGILDHLFVGNWLRRWWCLQNGRSWSLAADSCSCTNRWSSSSSWDHYFIHETAVSIAFAYSPRAAPRFTKVSRDHGYSNKCNGCVNDSFSDSVHRQNVGKV